MVRGPASSSTGQRSAAAMRVPTPRKTGNRTTDEENEMRRTLLQDMIDELIENPEHIIPVHTALMKRKHAGPVTSSEKCFASLTILSRLPKEFTMSWVTSHSDLEAQDIVNAMRRDSDALSQLVMLGTQMSGNLKLPDAMRNIDFARRVLTERKKLVGDRLTEFKKRGGVSPDGSLNWLKGGCYALEWNDDGRLAAIEHVASKDKAEVTDEYHITKDWVMHENYSDTGAFIQKLPRPPYKLNMFFDERLKTGPYTYDAFAGVKCKVWEKFVTDQYDAWMAAQETGVTADAAVEAIKHLENMQKEKRQEALESARKKAAEASATKKARRVIKLDVA